MIKLRGQILLSEGSFLPPKNFKCAVWHASSIRQIYRAVARNPNSVYFQIFLLAQRARIFVAVLDIALEGRPFLTEIPFAFFPIELI